MVSGISAIAAIGSAIIAVLVWLHMTGSAKRELRTLVEDLYDSLTERVDEIKSVNTNRWTIRASMYGLSGRTKSGSYEIEKTSWDEESERLHQAIVELQSLPNSYTQVNVNDLMGQRRILRRIERLYNYETQKQLEWSTDTDRTWRQSQDIKARHGN